MANVIYKIYEIQNTGKGVINTLEPENLLLIHDSQLNLQGLQSVMDVSNLLYGTQSINIDSESRLEIRAAQPSIDLAGYMLIQNADDNPTPLVPAILGYYGKVLNSTTAGLKVTNLGLFIEDNFLSKGIEYQGDYEPNFTDRSLITKQYLLSQIAAIPPVPVVSNQKIITYPTDFTGTDYTLLSSDHNKLIIVKNGVDDVNIIVPTGLTVEQFTAFFRQGTGEVSITASGTTIDSFDGLRINGRFQQVALDREGSTNQFYLTGNTKV